MKIPTLFGALVLMMLVLPMQAWAGYHRIARLACPDGKFVITARSEVFSSYDFNYGFGLDAELYIRYRYRGITLFHLRYGDYHSYLRGYLQADTSRTHKIGRSQRGYTLYLPPSRFSADEVERLASCIRANQSQLRQASSKTIRARSWLLWKNNVTINTNIAHLIHADPPLVDIYSSNDVVMIMERTGRIRLLPNQRNATEALDWGEIRPPRWFWFWGKPRVHVKAVRLGEKTYDSDHVNDYIDIGSDGINGRPFSKNYTLMCPDADQPKCCFVDEPWKFRSLGKRLVCALDF